VRIVFDVMTVMIVYGARAVCLWEQTALKLGKGMDVPTGEIERKAMAANW
jgi:hypothetical protein